MTERRCLVVGGGVIGLVSAFVAARQGWSVTLLDETPAGGATHAAAGMLAPSAEVAQGERESFLEQLEAVRAWDEFRDEIYGVTGHRVTLERVGTLLVAWDAGDRGLVSQFQRLCEEFGVDNIVRSRDEEPDVFAGLTARIRDGLFLPGDAWLDPDEVVEALLRALKVLGVEIAVARAEHVEETGTKVRVVSAAGAFEGDVGIIATGAEGPPPGLIFTSKVRPVRGITSRVRGLDRAGRPMVRAFIRGRSFYLVGRDAGYCVLGASSEERSEPFVELGELSGLLRDGVDLFPSLEAAQLIETRVGLRPATANQRSIFEISPQGRWAWSSGHFRHGITVSPLAGRAAKEFVGSFA